MLSRGELIQAGGAAVDLVQLVNGGQAAVWCTDGGFGGPLAEAELRDALETGAAAYTA